jgi:hypothetical protein
VADSDERRYRCNYEDRCALHCLTRVPDSGGDHKGFPTGLIESSQRGHVAFAGTFLLLSHECDFWSGVWEVIDQATGDRKQLIA